MTDLPDTPNMFMKSNTPITIDLEDFCTIGLGIPLSNLHHWERPTDYDAYRIVMQNGLQFVISGPGLAAFVKTQEDYR